jgi:hypothetical protein
VVVLLSMCGVSFRKIDLHKLDTSHLFNKGLSYCIRSLESLLGFDVVNLSDEN